MLNYVRRPNETQIGPRSRLTAHAERSQWPMQLSGLVECLLWAAEINALNCRFVVKSRSGQLPTVTSVW
jgi:hypothetical protein